MRFITLHSLITLNPPADNKKPCDTRYGTVTYDVTTELPQPSAAEDRLKNIQEFSPCRKENTTFHRYKGQPVNAD
jgi:hypothetical protein